MLVKFKNLIQKNFKTIIKFKVHQLIKRNNIKEFMKKTSAFSLIELSIVILIIGILVAGVTQSSRLVKQFRLQTARQLTTNSPVNTISNLAFWIESIQTGSFQESEASEGASVTSWIDVNKITTQKATTTLAGVAPIYRQSAINSLPAVQFNGNGCFYINHVNIVSTTQKTFFAVFLETGKNSASGTYLYDNFIVPPQFAFILTTSFQGQIFGGSSVVAGSIPLNKPHILTVVHNTGSSFFRVNGTESPRANSGGNIMGNVTRLGGGGCTYVFDTFYGYIGEFIIFDRVLKPDEYIDVENYLSKKWGIKLN